MAYRTYHLAYVPTPIAAGYKVRSARVALFRVSYLVLDTSNPDFAVPLLLLSVSSRPRHTFFQL